MEMLFNTKETQKKSINSSIWNCKNNVASANSFSLLIDKIKQNPAGDYELTSDVDVNSFTIKDDYIFTNEFTGTLNGNGHIIKNITKPLFNTLNNANSKFSNRKCGFKWFKYDWNNCK